MVGVTYYANSADLSFGETMLLMMIVGALTGTATNKTFDFAEDGVDNLKNSDCWNDIDFILNGDGSYHLKYDPVQDNYYDYYNYIYNKKLKSSLKNIDDFIDGYKSFDEVLDDYARIYADKVNSNLDWSWNKSINGGENLSNKQKKLIKERAVKNGHIPYVKVTKVEGMKYGFADFEAAGLVKETIFLPEEMWTLSDQDQFKWLNEKIGGEVPGYTWHHTEIPGKMQLVPTGIHNIITHNGGRSPRMWADAPR